MVTKMDAGGGREAVDYRALRKNFEEGATLNKLRRELQVSRHSHDTSAAFIAKAQENWFG